MKQRDVLVAQMNDAGPKVDKDNGQDEAHRVRKELATFSERATKLQAGLTNPACTVLLEDAIKLEKSYAEAVEQTPADYSAKFAQQIRQGFGSG